MLRTSGACDRPALQAERRGLDMAMQRITLPFKHQYPTAAGYYQSTQREMVRWTGHPVRLNQTFLLQVVWQWPRSGAYAREELRTEVKSAIVGDRLAHGHNPKHMANYVGGWVTRLSFGATSTAPECLQLSCWARRDKGAAVGEGYPPSRSRPPAHPLWLARHSPKVMASRLYRTPTNTDGPRPLPAAPRRVGLGTDPFAIRLNHCCFLRGIKDQVATSAFGRCSESRAAVIKHADCARIG